MSLDYYNAQQKHWISPRLALLLYNELHKIFGETKLKSEKFKKVQEGKTVALTLLGIHKLTGIHFMMQIPKEINSSPDVVTMHLTEYEDNPVQMQLQDIEVVEFSDNTKEDIATFLLNTKLDPKVSKKAYDNKTIIICHITQKSVLINHIDLHQKIKAINPKPAVYLLGSIPNTIHKYRLVRIYPRLDKPITIDAITDANNYPKPHSTKFTLGMSKKIIHGESNLPLPTPFEVFEIKEE